ncbi:hypothetical protein [Dyella amyloliquefaciens]|uniref:hypothetical protein n=1 Tax=Dyella amyloliquefaciens TaxID=1770545 RepID=UPI00102E58E4|nr:hypothetical protein [Dyella amyloliquefaciens]
MNRKDVVGQVAAMTGLATPVCEKALEAFEDVCGDALTGAFKGTRHNHARVIAEMARRTGASEQACQDILKAFEKVLEDTLRDKLGFGRKKGL